MSKIKLFLLTGIVAAAVAPLYGCGSECGPGSTERDGQCVLVAEGCGEGTALENKQCVVDDSGCGEGTVLSAGECVPSEASCGEGLNFDRGLGQCIPDTEIVCGGGTEANSDGICTPVESACGEKTAMNDDGHCVVQPAICGHGTELDPNSGECLLVDAACDTGLALDAATGTCVVTEEVCAAGTVWAADSGLCLPDNCREGNVLVDGICMTPGEELAHTADLKEVENNDPAMGGTAQTVTTPAVGEPAFTLAGAIGEPTDLDGDTVVDQDVDVFTFDATSGDWLELMVQSTGLPMPVFKVEGPNGYVRWSANAGARDVARDLVLPADGTYTLTVMSALQLEGSEGAVGVADWGYVGSLRVVDAPTPTTLDASTGSASLSGDLVDLSDNLFTLTGLAADDALTLQMDSEAAAVVHVLDDAGAVQKSHALVRGEKVRLLANATGEASLLVDWVDSDAVAAGFDLTASVTGSYQPASVAAGETKAVTVSAAQFDRLAIAHTNPVDARLDLLVKNPSGEIVLGRRTDSGEEIELVAFAAGDYVVEVTNNTANPVDATLMVHVDSPSALGELADGSTATSPVWSGVSGDETFFSVSANAGQVLTLTHDNTEATAVDITAYDATGEVVLSHTSVQATSGSSFDVDDFLWQHLQADTALLIQVKARGALSGATLTAQSITPSNEGTISAGNPVSFTNTTGLPAGYSAFHTIDVGAQTNYAGSVLSATDADVDVFLYDMQGVELVEEDGNGDEIFGAFNETAGTILMRVQCDEACTGYDVSVGSFSDVENLGSIAAGSTVTSNVLPVLPYQQPLSIEFSVPAGHIVELWHDNASSYGSIELLVNDANGVEVEKEGYYDYTCPINDTSYCSSYPKRQHFWSGAGGNFSIELEGPYGGSLNQMVGIRVIDPKPTGALYRGDSFAQNDATVMGADQWYVWEVNLAETGVYSGSMLPGGTGEELELELRQSNFEDERSWYSTMGFGGAIDTAGTYLMIGMCEETCTGVDFQIELREQTTDLGPITSNTSVTHTVGNLNDGQRADLVFQVPTDHIIEFSHSNDQGIDSRFELLDATGARLYNDYSFYPTTSSNSQYGYAYSGSGGEFTLELTGDDVATNEVVEIEVYPAPYLGELSTTNSVSWNETQSKDAGRSYAMIVDVAEPMSFDGTLLPSGSASLSFAINDLRGGTLVEKPGTSSSLSFSDTIGAGGKYMVLVGAGSNASGFELTLGNVAGIGEDLGDLAVDTSATSSVLAAFNDGDAQSYTFSVKPGQVIEVSHDNDDDEDHDVELYDGNGIPLDSDSIFQPVNYYSPDFMYWYAKDGGKFTVVLTGDHTVVNQTLTVRSFTPGEVGPLAIGSGQDVTGGALIDNQSDVYSVTLQEAGRLHITGQAVNNSEDIEVRVMDENFDQIAVSTAADGIDHFVSLDAGTYLIKIEAAEDLASYSGRFALFGPPATPQFSSAPAAHIEGESGPAVTDKIAVSQCYSVVSVEVFVDISHTSRDDLTVTLTSPNGTTVTLHDEGGSTRDDLYGWYPSPLTVSGPGSLANFVGEVANGDWQISVDSNGTSSYSPDGTLNEWGLTLGCQ